MRAPISFKQEFLKRWTMGLQVCSSVKQDMGIWERKKAIKLSADIAMASTRNVRTCWSRALIAEASKDNDNKVLVERMLACESEKRNKVLIGASLVSSKRVRSNKILKRSCCIRKARKSTVTRRVLAKSIAKRMLKQRTKVLKSLVPGGEFMDDVSLIEETLDYIISLRAQIDVMHTLVKATELMNDE